MELRDTAEMMASPDFKERFRAEYLQLETRANSLGSMLLRWEAGALDFEPKCPAGLLNAQYNAMQAYLEILRLRAEIEDIEL